jgi:dTMP kinase
VPDLPSRQSAPGLFVVLEGGEGVGKSTQVRKVETWLREAGYACLTTREPGATPLGARLRDCLLTTRGAEETPTARAEALLYAADRAQHVATVIRPALARGAVVVSDRYVDSSLAYQGAGRALAPEEIARLSEWASEGLTPDLVVLLDLDPEVGLARAAGRGAMDRLERESREFHARVRAGFLDRAEADPPRYLVLDAGQPADLVAEQIRDRLLPLLPSAPEPLR